MADATRLRGRRLSLRYDDGLEVIADYVGSNELVWKAVAGPSAGSEGREIYESALVAPDVFFVSWLERGGTTVSQVLDLAKGHVVSYITFDTPNGRQAVFLEGEVEEVT